MSKRTLIIISVVIVSVVVILIFTMRGKTQRGKTHKIRGIYKRSDTQIWVNISGFPDVKEGDKVQIINTKGKYDGDHTVLETMKETRTTSIAVGLTFKTAAEHKTTSGMVWTDYRNKSGELIIKN